MDLDMDTATVSSAMNHSGGLPFSYQVERVLYGIAIVVGCAASLYTILKFRRSWRTKIEIAARTLTYKVSLSIADAIILFIYAPAQFVWITSYWWYGGDALCRMYKFVAAFGFHLTVNMQVVIAFDRLFCMSRLHRIRQKATSGYNTRCFLCLAWSLALVCSFPQLFVFRVVYITEDQPQCVSVWMVARFEYVDQWHQIEQEFAKYDVDSVPVELTRSLEALESDRFEMELIERVYNVMHLSTLCFLPYLVELVFYALILSLLNEAKRSDFTGFRSFARRRLERLMCKLEGGESTCGNSEFERTTAVTPSLCSSRSALAQPPSATSRSRAASPLSLHRFESTDVHRLIDLGVSRIARSGSSFRRSFRRSPRFLSIRDLRGSRHHAERKLSRRESAPCLARDQNSAPPSPISTVAPWLSTLKHARRTARRKAFLMLSCNLIFWLPYCVLAITSSLTLVEDFQQYQYVCALVVFNAITNILL